jgi:hypothetical protein
MPADARPEADEIGAPTLCPHHRAVLARAEDLDHLDHEVTRDQAAQMARQCCNRRKP